MKHNLIGGSTVVGLFTLFFLIWLLTPTGGAGSEVREIVLEARDLAFDGDNPTLRLEPGSRVRLVVRNTDPGVLHSITLPGIDDRVRFVEYGREITVEFTVPPEGRFDYVCPQHAPKMQGRIVVN